MPVLLLDSADSFSPVTDATLFLLAWASERLVAGIYEEIIAFVEIQRRAGVLHATPAALDAAFASYTSSAQAAVPWYR
jgi:hypothetical protein